MGHYSWHHHVSRVLFLTSPCIQSIILDITLYSGHYSWHHPSCIQSIILDITMYSGHYSWHHLVSRVLFLTSPCPGHYSWHHLVLRALFLTPLWFQGLILEVTLISRHNSWRDPVFRTLFFMSPCFQDIILDITLYPGHYSWHHPVSRALFLTSPCIHTGHYSWHHPVSIQDIILDITLLLFSRHVFKALFLTMVTRNLYSPFPKDENFSVFDSFVCNVFFGSRHCLVISIYSSPSVTGTQCFTSCVMDSWHYLLMRLLSWQRILLWNCSNIIKFLLLKRIAYS